MVACLAAADAVINLLLDHPRLNVSVSGNEHSGPLQFVVHWTANKVAMRLVQHPTTVVDGRDEAGFSAWLRAVNDQNIPLLKALAAGVDVNLALVVPDRAYDFDPMLAWMQTIHPDSFEADDLRYMNPKIQWVASTNRHECTDATVASCKGGKTALMVACLYSNEAMVECLLSQPTIDLNAVDDVRYRHLFPC
ncbi:hypothetical protein SDRG_12016 [Saprolegnia diclina VS20]|uniref:Uncharacterized protein n=1 Tax=Saprolegnia diclina (strain VS20) TaxID=1156394 RepID=T0RD41_SAPDV|nr:hypothetical protein SDRG_12016 [Saprolegnia diclina VS20]EQC30163.1 hypothetical protein SDRG_12016 [Saprolegnia diclina VS20]|eukprot:XP_008616295.1 hypothetical protein SDRG_12016 [Saprolegnia diclina VS20]